MVQLFEYPVVRQPIRRQPGFSTIPFLLFKFSGKKINFSPSQRLNKVFSALFKYICELRQTNNKNKQYKQRGSYVPGLLFEAKHTLRLRTEE